MTKPNTEAFAPIDYDEEADFIQVSRDEGVPRDAQLRPAEGTPNPEPLSGR